MEDVAAAIEWAMDVFEVDARVSEVAIVGLSHVPKGVSLQRLHAFNPWKPEVDALAAQGLSVEPSERALGEDRFDLVIARPEREGTARRVRLARVLLALREGGELLIAAPVREGGKRLADELEGLGAEVRDVQAKARCRVVRAVRAPNADREALRAAVAEGEPRRVEGLWSAPGLFSWDHVDRGSALLARTLPDVLGDRVIDAGAGWGFLSHAISAKPGRCRVLALLEADHRALELAVRNVAPGVTVRSFWVDATAPWPIEGADAVVCNPPFHEGGRATRVVGEKMLAEGLVALHPQGVLWAVANQHLPYERWLESLGARVEVCAQDDGFKVLRARLGASR